MSAYSQITPTLDANAHRQARLRAVYGGEPNVVDQSRVDKLISIFDKYAAKEAANGYNKLVIRLMQHRSDKHKVSLADINGQAGPWTAMNFRI